MNSDRSDCLIENLPIEINFMIADVLDKNSVCNFFSTSNVFFHQGIHVYKWREKLLAAGMQRKLFDKIYSIKNKCGKPIITNWRNLFVAFVRLPPARREAFNENDVWQMLCLTGERRAVYYLLDNHDAEKCDKFGAYAEHYFAISHSFFALQLYVSHFKNIKIKSDMDGYDIRHYSALSHNPNMLGQVLHHFRLPLIPDLLHVVARYGSLNMFIELLHSNLNANFRDKNGCTAFHVAVISNIKALDFIKLGLKLELNQAIKAEDNLHRTIIYYAAKLSKLDVLTYGITELKMSPFTHDRYDKSPIKVAEVSPKPEETKEAILDAVENSHHFSNK